MSPLSGDRKERDGHAGDLEVDVVPLAVDGSRCGFADQSASVSGVQMVVVADVEAQRAGSPG